LRIATIIWIIMLEAPYCSFQCQLWWCFRTGIRWGRDCS